MPFALEDAREGLNIFYKHPEWREELRRIVLTNEILELPAIVRQLAEVQRDLAEAQCHTEQRMEELAQAQARLGSAARELQHAFGATIERGSS